MGIVFFINLRSSTAACVKSHLRNLTNFTRFCHCQFMETQLGDFFLTVSSQPKLKLRATYFSIALMPYYKFCHAFKKYYLYTPKILVDTYSWHCVPTSIHIVLIHGPLIIQWAPLSIGQLFEEAQEWRDKDIKRYRDNFSRKCSRESTMTDLFHWLLMSSDPLISSLKVDLPKKVSNE